MTGLAMIAGGLWWISPPVAVVVVGVVVFSLAIYGIMR